MGWRRRDGERYRERQRHRDTRRERDREMETKMQKDREVQLNRKTNRAIKLLRNPPVRDTHMVLEKTIDTETLKTHRETETTIPRVREIQRTEYRPKCRQVQDLGEEELEKWRRPPEKRIAV